MRSVWLTAVLVVSVYGYDLTGRIDPPSTMPVFLHGTSSPFETETMSGPDGRFRFRKLAAGTYTLAVSTQARGEALQTIELSPGTVDSKGRLDVVVKIGRNRLETDGVHARGATVSAIVLSIPEPALREYREAQRCLSRRESECASEHLRKAVGIAPKFTAAWNQLGTIAYQTGRFPEAEANFRKALAADAEAFEPLVNLGGVLLNLSRPKEALSYNREAVARRPNNALANSQLGLTYFELEDLSEAEKYLKLAVAIDPAHFSHPQLVLADIYLRRGDMQAARAALSDFLERHPDASEAAVVRRTIASLESR
jgi:Tfp pilus assembly protein PilF